jgi:hypothetical protein
VTVYRIVVERISTGERGPGGIVRCASEAEARAHAEAGIRQSPTPDDLRVVAVLDRP